MEIAFGKTDIAFLLPRKERNTCYMLKKRMSSKYTHTVRQVFTRCVEHSALYEFPGFFFLAYPVWWVTLGHQQEIDSDFSYISLPTPPNYYNTQSRH